MVMKFRRLQLILGFAIIFAGCLATPPPGHIPTPSTDLNPPKYEYGYVVSDKQGGTQGHVESRDGVYALGRYHVTLPDGTGQKVTYFADDWGYHPLVSYSSSSYSGTSSAQFAMGDKAVAALKDGGSPSGNLINPNSQGVQVINPGSSGHYQHNQASVTTESTTATSGGLIYTTTPAPPIQSPIPPANTIIVANSQTNILPASQEVAVSSTPRPQSESALINPAIISPVQQYLTQNQQQFIENNHLVQVNANQPYVLPPVTYPEPSPLGTTLLRESQGYENVQIVTPTPQENATETAEFTHAGQSIQITSYLADTNRVLNYGDRIRDNEKHVDAKLLEHIQEHAKLRIFQDIENSINPTSQPIVVASGTPVYEETDHSNLQTNGQYQALGYQQRLVDKQANQIIKESNPVLQELQTQQLLQKQEQELKEAQEDLKGLQQQIINEIDAQHEEEQNRQKTVAEERRKHIDGLEKVEQVVHSLPSNDILPPLAEDVRKSSFINNDYLPPVEPTGESFVPPQYLVETQKQIMVEVETTPTAQPPIQEPLPLPQPVVQSRPISANSNQQIITSALLPSQSVTPTSELLPPQTQDQQVIPETLLPPEVANPPLEPSGLLPPQAEPVRVIQEEMRDTLAPPPLPYFSHFEKPVLIPQSVPPVESTKLLTVEKPIPYPVTLTRVVQIDRPVPIPTPYTQSIIPIPYPVPQAIGVPYPQLIPYPEYVPFPLKQYHPVIISKSQPKPLELDNGYHTIPLHLKLAPYTNNNNNHYHKSKSVGYRQGRSKNSLKNLRIEYGFKPPLVPSAEFAEELKPSPYGPAVRS